MTARKKPAKLLPCPVCGGSAWLTIIYGPKHAGWAAQCSDLWHGIHVLGDYDADAARRWNALPRRRAKAGKGARRG